jgi:hypothetical protein
MSYFKTLFASIFLVLLGTALFAQTGPQPSPKIAVSPSKVLHPNHVEMKGTGFTPKSDVNSHLRRPDGTEFRILQMYTNDKGEIEHDIDTIVMLPGVYELWVDDVKAKTTSNVARFEVTMNSKDLEK